MGRNSLCLSGEKPFEEGQQAWDVAKGDVRKAFNPYRRFSPQWREWNLGWNSNLHREIEETATAGEAIRLAAEVNLFPWHQKVANGR